MFSWELTLAVRRTTCELRLWALYNRYGNVVVQRRRCPEMGPSWHKKDDVLAAIHREIRRELDEIRFLRAQQQASAVGVFRLVLHKSGGDFHQVEPGPRIIDLIQQVIETNEAATGWKDTDYGMGVIAGLKEALDVFYNPYKYLSSEQQKEFTGAEDARDKIIRNRAGAPPESLASRSAGAPGPTLAQLRAEADTEVVVRRSRGNTC